MEHADYISDAVSHTAAEFSSIHGIVTWIKLFLALIIPIIAGIGIATAILQIFLKPLLVTLLVTPDFGFTEGGIAYMLQYLAVLIGLLFPLFFPYYIGYISRCMQTKTAPEMENLWSLFFAGWRMNILCLYYAIPLIVIFLLYTLLFTFINTALTTLLPIELAGIASVIDYISLILSLIIEFATGIFLSLFAFIGLVHLSRSGSLKEAINMGRIIDIIRKIGWYNYLLCIVIVAILFLAILIFFLGIASVFGYALLSNIIIVGILLFILIPFGIFVAQYLSNIYDTAFLEPEEDIEDFDDF